jgi:hypothetical protein
MSPAGTLFVGKKRIGKHANDADVRALLREYLHDLNRDTDTVLLEELGLCQGDVRVDVATVNGELSGFEIKSPSDTLARWPNQLKVYSKVVDRAWLVAPTKAIDKAVAPEWWGLIGVFEVGDRLALRVARPSGLNPKPDPRSIAKLLWRDEALEVLRNAGHARGVMTKSRAKIWKRLIETVSLEDLRASVRAALRRRPEMIALLEKR